MFEYTVQSDKHGPCTVKVFSTNSGDWCACIFNEKNEEIGVLYFDEKPMTSEIQDIFFN